MRNEQFEYNGGGNSPLMINGTNIFELIYPVGSVYLTMNATSPADLFGGTWEQLAEGYTLWTASSDAGETIEAGLPNITGYLDAAVTNNSKIWKSEGSGALYNNYSATSTTAQASNGTITRSSDDCIRLDASRSSSIYGNSDTVQPPAIKVYAWRRTA